MICGGHVGTGWQQASGRRKPEFHRAGETVRPKQSEDDSRYGILCEQMDCEEEATQEGPEGHEAQEGSNMEEFDGKMNRLRKPEEPTQREFEEHMVLHLPFRAWCPQCVKGRSKSEPHRVNKESAEEIIPTVAMDYMWMKSREESRNKSDEEDQEMRGMPILVIKDSKSGCIDANVVPRKGECGFATKCAV